MKATFFYEIQMGIDTANQACEDLGWDLPWKNQYFDITSRDEEIDAYCSLRWGSNSTYPLSEFLQIAAYAMKHDTHPYGQFNANATADDKGVVMWDCVSTNHSHHSSEAHYDKKTLENATFEKLEQIRGILKNG